MTIKDSLLFEGNTESMDSQFLSFMFVWFHMVTIFYLIVAYFSFFFVIFRTIVLCNDFS